MISWLIINYSTILLYKYSILIMRRKDEIHGFAYKLFYLTDDHTNSVFEKVFICGKDVLKNIKFGIQPKIQLVGLVGSVKEICKYLVGFYCRSSKQSMENGDYELKLTEMGIDINLQSLAASNEKPSVYLIKLKPKQKQQKQTIFLALISKNQLYYQKPYDQKSLAYILIRFIGDLTNDILLLYDTKMLSQFNESDCPYSSMNNRYMELQIKETNRSTIQIKDVDCECQEVLQSEDKQDINWGHSFVITQNCYLQCFKKIDERAMENRDNLDRNIKKQKIWKKILEDGLEHDTIGVDQKTEGVANYQQAAKELKELHHKIKKQIESMTVKCFRCVERILCKQKNIVENFRLYEQIDKKLEEIYFRTIQQLESRIQNNQIIITKIDRIAEIMENQSIKLLELLYSRISTEQAQDKSDEIKQQILILCLYSVNQLNLKIFPRFFPLVETVLSIDPSLYKNWQKIQITRFELIRSQKNNEITKTIFKKEQKITVFLHQLKKHVPQIQLRKIKDLKIFKAKFIRECKVLLLSRQIEENSEQYEHLLMIIERGEIKVIAKYQEKQLVFTFDEKLRKVFIFKPNSQQKILTTFILDEFQKPRNENQYYLAKKQQQSQSNFLIISYSFSRTPNERFYYLDQRRDTLYCYDLTEKSGKEFYTEGQQLKPLRGKFYEIVKAFNHNIYIALGNAEVIDVYLMSMNGELNALARTFQCKSSSFFKGMSTYSDDRNQYLTIYGENQFQMAIFEHMGSENFIKQSERKVNLGNPIIDIFYEAQNKFGDYTTYTVCKNTPNIKKINLFHIIEQNGRKDKISAYLKLINIKNHERFVVYENELEELYKKQFLCVTSEEFINEAQSRIPVQICSVQYGNIIPLKDGNIINNFDGKEATIEKRCQVLTFGIVERMLKQDTNKRTIVVSIMGGQSTGKSYLLNRIFGTRFTVASCRTTIGIWASLIKTQTINFLILDCEGLFGIHREMNQQEKLIKILTGVSDFTILNLSKGMINKSHSEFMGNLSRSVRRAQNSKQLYNGDLFIVVRDVCQNQQQGIIQEMMGSFYSHQDIKQFIRSLFNRNSDNRNLAFYNFPIFTEAQNFAKSAEDMRDIFMKRSSEKPIRNSETVLELLKIVMNQLACDHNQLPEEIMEKRIIQLIEQKAENTWRKGSESEHFEGEIMGIKFSIQDSAIQIPISNNAINFHPLQKFFDIFQDKIQQKKPIDSVSFSTAYKELNAFIIKFFEKRQSLTNQIVIQYVASIPNKTPQLGKKIEQKVNFMLDQKIKTEKKGLRLCLEQCSPSCEQPCIKIYQHKVKISQKIQSLSNKNITKINELSNCSLTQQQKQRQQLGIPQLKQQCETKIGQIKRILQKYEQKKQLSITLEQLQHSNYRILNQITNLTNQIKTSNRHQQQLTSMNTNIKQIYELYQQFMGMYVKNDVDKFGMQMNEIVNNKELLIKLLARLQKRDYCQNSEDLEQIMAQLACLTQMITQLVEDRTQIEQLSNSTSTQIENKTTQIAHRSTQQQQIKSQITYISNQLTITHLHTLEQQLSAQLQKMKEESSSRQAELASLNKITSNSIYKAESKQQYIITSIHALMRKKKKLLSVYYKQVAFVEEQINQMYLQYNVNEASKLQKKLKLLLGRRTNPPQLIQNLKQKNSMIGYLSKSQALLQEQANQYNNLKAKIMSEYNLQQNRNIYQEQINLIEYICDYDPNDKDRICMYIGIFGEYYNSGEVLKLCWYKIMESFDQKDKDRLSKEISDPEIFFSKIDELNNIDLVQKIKQQEEKYESLQVQLQEFLNAQLSSDISSMSEQKQNDSLMEERSLIESLIEYDKVLLKCEKFCKIQSIRYFMRMVGYLGRVCGRNQSYIDGWKSKVIDGIVENNPDLKIQLTKQGFTGQFKQSFSQLSKILEDYSFSYQKQLYAIQKIEPSTFLYKLRQKIQNIRKAHSGSSKFELFLKYIEEVSRYFTDCEKKNQYQFCVISKWFQTLENENKEQNQDRQNIFLNVLLISCLEVCGTMQKLANNYNRYLERKAQLQSQLQPIRKQYEVKQSKLKIIKQKILNKQKENSEITLSAQLDQLQNQQLTPLLKSKQQELIQIEADLNKRNKQLEELQGRKILFDQFVSKISKASQINFQSILLSFEKESKQNISRTSRISENKNQLQKIKQRKQEIQKELGLINAILQQLNQQNLQKQLKCQEQAKKGLISLQGKIAQINQINESIQSIKKQIEDLKKSPQLECSCLTNHKCDRKCEVGCNSIDKICLQKAGHTGKHACNDHKCGQRCQIDAKCQIGCMKVYGHTKDQVHNCGSLHSCQQKCKYCDKACRQSQFRIHEQHNCGETKCPQKCILCNQNCNNLNHNHNDVAEIVTIYKESKQEKKKLHLCSSSHTCQNLCSHPGVCSNTYAHKDGFWKKNTTSIKYQYIEQIQVKKQCVKKIDPLSYKHEEQCKCDVNHKCTYRCPDCKSLCSSDYGHSETKNTLHKTAHRNQELLIWAAETEDKVITINQNNQNFIFDVGEVSTPFRCYQSCLRKGRGHFHLIQCPGGQLCYEKKLKQGAKHSKKVYNPHKDKIYDMLLCHKYWEVHNFEMPVNEISFKKCNFACTIKEQHKDKNNTYCEKQAWHSMSTNRLDHQFLCTHKRLSINAIEICFLLDMSGSMFDYNKKSKQTIERIIQSCNKNQLEKTRFAVVGYRDHRMSQSPLFLKLKKLCIEKKKILSDQPLEGGFTQLMTQSTFEDVLLKMQKIYNHYSNQQNFIEKFNQTQQLILKYHYPFVLDVKSSRRFLDQSRRQKKQKKYYEAIKNLESTKPQNLKQLLEGELNYFIRYMDKELRQEVQNLDKSKLLECLKFTTPEDCIRFLDKLQAVGGGDPPEAMLDGMAAASQLSWSSGENTMKYIFHLFDAPPHGQIFDSNSEDYYPEGCPCNKKADQIIKKIMKNKINYFFYPFTQRVRQTIDVFKSLGLEFTIKEIKNTKNSQQFIEHASLLICKQIQQTQITVRK